MRRLGEGSKQRLREEKVGEELSNEVQRQLYKKMGTEVGDRETHSGACCGA